MLRMVSECLKNGKLLRFARHVPFSHISLRYAILNWVLSLLWTCRTNHALSCNHVYQWMTFTRTLHTLAVNGAEGMMSYQAALYRSVHFSESFQFSSRARSRIHIFRDGSQLIYGMEGYKLRVVALFRNYDLNLASS